MSIGLFSHQTKFVYSESKYPALVSGYGAGKTYALCVKALKECGFNSGYTGILMSPTYRMIKDTLQPTLEEVIKIAKFNYEYSASDNRYRIYWSDGYADILLRSAENYRRLAGLNLAWAGIDESALLKDDQCWKMVLSRLRQGNTLRAFVCTTPEGFNYVYRYWKEDVKEGYELIQADTESNSKLPEEFIQSLKDNYDEKLIKAYMQGQFVNLQYGATYYNFDRKINVQKTHYNQNKPICIGIDFNVDPMCAVVSQMHANGKVQVINEFKIRHSGGKELITEQMAIMIKDNYPNQVYYCYPDPSGKQRKTSSIETDHDILRQNGFILRFKKQAPRVVDRVNAVNKLFDNLIIDPKCKNLIADFEQVVNKEGTRDIDKSNPELTHMSDGFGYFVEYEYPIRKPETKSFMA
tara:strand:+ start:10253 stop:11479 length:1227 start_codon:yes stop_codon:yes gene_type:complete